MRRGRWPKAGGPPPADRNHGGLAAEELSSSSRERAWAHVRMNASLAHVRVCVQIAPMKSDQLGQPFILLSVQLLGDATSPHSLWRLLVMPGTLAKPELRLERRCDTQSFRT